MTDAAQLHRLINSLPSFTVMVIGDVMLDEYIIGEADRLSREAPIPVLEFRERRMIPGGAANPAANIAALGAEALQFSLTGDDVMGEHLKREMGQRSIDTRSVLATAQHPTTVKTRIMAQMGLRFPQQVARVDTIDRTPFPQLALSGLLGSISQHITSADAVLLSDYRVGLLTTSFVAEIGGLAHSAGVLLTADAQGQFAKYKGADLVKCNADEAGDYLRRDLHSDADFEQAARDLRRELDLRQAMVITRGAKGATVAESDDVAYHVPAPRIRDVFDTVGAGDTTIAVITLAMAAGATVADAVRLANYASGIVVQHVGNYAPTPDQLREAVNNGK